VKRTALPAAALEVIQENRPREIKSNRREIPGLPFLIVTFETRPAAGGFGVPRGDKTFAYSDRGVDVTHRLMAGHCKALTESPVSRDARQPITLAKPASSMAA
jgi:hypothetical protein